MGNDVVERKNEKPIPSTHFYGFLLPITSGAYPAIPREYPTHSPNKSLFRGPAASRAIDTPKVCTIFCACACFDAQFYEFKYIDWIDELLASGSLWARVRNEARNPSQMCQRTIRQTPVGFRKNAPVCKRMLQMGGCEVLKGSVSVGIIDLANGESTKTNNVVVECWLVLENPFFDVVPIAPFVAAASMHLLGKLGNRDQTLCFGLFGSQRSADVARGYHTAKNHWVKCANFISENLPQQTAVHCLGVSLVRLPDEVLARLPTRADWKVVAEALGLAGALPCVFVPQSDDEYGN